MTTSLETTIRFSLTDQIKVLSVGNTMETLLGYKPEDFLSGRVSLIDRIHADDQDVADTLFSRAPDETSTTFNIRLRHADGRIRCVKAHSSRRANDSAPVLELRLQDAKSLWQGMGEQPVMANFSAMMENTDDYIYFKDRNHVFTGASQTLVAITEPSEHWTDLLGLTDYDVFPEAYADVYYRLEKQVFSGITVAHEVQETLDNEGNKGWVDNRKYPIKNEAGEIIGLFGVARDITEEKRKELALRDSEEFLRESQIIAGLGSYVLDIRSRVWRNSAELHRVLGIDEAYPHNVRGLLALIHNDDRGGILDHCRNEVFGQGKVFDKQYRIVRRSDGVERWVHSLGKLHLDARGQPLSLRGTVQDITERRHELLAGQRAILESRLVGIVTMRDRQIIWTNATFDAMLGYDQEELTHIPARRLFANENDYQALESWIYRNIESGSVVREQYELLRSDGRPVWVEASGALLHKETRETLWVMIDITERKEASRKIEQLAYYDYLTQLPNRQRLLGRIKLALTTCAQENKHGALLFIDLDNFKTLNDTLGHDIGDLLLQQVAKQFESCLRPNDTVARLGGDEFVVILEILSGKRCEAAAQAETIANKIMASINQSYRLGPHEYYSTASIGVTLFGKRLTEATELLKQADIAMYQAKKSGRGSIGFFEPQMQSTISARAALEKSLRSALDEQQFTIYYQPQIGHDGKVVGAEALIRWLHPDRGLVSPALFIPIAEETGMIRSIGQWVIDRVCAQLKLWQKNPMTRELGISVNVSAIQFMQNDFVTKIQSTLQHYAIPPSLLKLELTESVLLENVENIVASMTALKAIGIQFSLDDFGTGYSSLQYLNRLPLAQLKIDQYFVREICTDSNDAVIVSTIIAMARSLNLDVIAEGVETEEQRQALLSKGCTNYQGYLFGKPVPIEQFVIPEA